jgi:hypothetical protein
MLANSLKKWDSSWFTKKAWSDLKKLIKEAKEWIWISKTYTNTQDLINDLRKNAVKY